MKFWLVPYCLWISESNILLQIKFSVFFSVHNPEWDVSANSEKGCSLHKGIQTVRDRVWRSELLHLSLRKNMQEDDFIRVTVGVIYRYFGKRLREWTIVGKIFSSVSSGGSLVAIYGGSHTSIECYKEYLGSGYTKTLTNYTTFDARFLKRCRQKTSSVVFGILDHFLITDINKTRLKGAEHRDWIHSRQPLRRATKMGNFPLPGLIDVVSNMIGMWLLNVFNWKEPGKKDCDVSFVVCLFVVVSIFT